MISAPITDDMVDRAMAERVELIQGFSYPTRHCIRDFRNDGRGVDVWECPIGNDAEFMRQLNFLKMKARLTAALSVPSQERA